MLTLVAALAILAGTPPPLPDPAPQAPKGRKVHFVAYTISVPAIDAATGEAIPELFFKCLVPTRWKGKPNRSGRWICTLHARPWAAAEVKACADAIRQKVYSLDRYGQCLADYAVANELP